MSKISRYSIAIFLSIFIEQLFINNHTIFMQVEAALWWWRHKNKHTECFRAREGEAGPGVGGEGAGGGGGGGGGTAELKKKCSKDYNIIIVRKEQKKLRLTVLYASR